MLIQLLKSYFTTKFRSFNSRADLEEWQDFQVQNHLKRILKVSKYYRDLYQGLDVSLWREFPIISKQEMMKNFSILNTLGIDVEDAYKVALDAEMKQQGSSTIGAITVGLSSGTSGHRSLFLVSPDERLRWAGAVLAKMLPKSLFHRQKIAFFFRVSSPLYTTISSKTIRFEHYNLEIPIHKHVCRLNTQQPTILVASASMLRKLAVELQSERLKILPQKIISISEVLDPIDETFIAASFGQKIHQIYQATEGFLATTCEHGTLHLNEDNLVIQKEPISGVGNKFYPIITDFYRHSQPIIRYRLNDILEECESPCPCGSIFTPIKSIEGRSDDIFYFKSENTLKPIFPDYIRRAIITAHPGIQEYFAIQLNPDELNLSIKIQASDEKIAQNAIRSNLLHLFQTFHTEIPRISFFPYVAPEGVTKLRRIERKFQVNM